MIKKFEKEGVKSTRLPDDILHALKKATDEVLTKEAAKDAMFKKVLDAQRAFVAEYKTWKDLGYLPRDWQ